MSQSEKNVDVYLPETLNIYCDDDINESESRIKCYNMHTAH